MALFHVLEHFPDLVGFLRELRELINPDGCLVIEVPDISDALVSLYQVPAYLDLYFQKAHLYYFSRDTLASALREGGFQAKIESLQRYDLSNHLVCMLHGQPDGLGYYRNVFSPTLDCAYAESLINSGHADTLWAVAQPSG